MSVFPDRIRLKNTTDSLATTVTDLTPFGLSGSFSASNSYLTLPANNVLAMGTSDFTIETWVYLGAPNNARTIIDTQPIGTSFQRNNAMLIIVEANARINIYSASNYRGMSTSALLAGQWNHIAIVRSGTTWRYFINGIKDATEYTYSVDLSLATGAIIGRSSENTGPLPFNGNLQDFRITKGVARYSTNFTLPTGPFPEGVNDPYFSNVSLLLHMVGPHDSTVFTDSSINNLTVTPNGSAKISNLLGLFAPPDPLRQGEVVIHRGDGEVRMLAQTTVKTIAQLSAGIENENKGSLTVTNYGYGSTSFVLNDGAVTNSKILDGTIVDTKLSAAIGIAKGGTGQTTRDAAITALLPSQASNTNKVLTTDGSNITWQTYGLSSGSGNVSINALNDVNTLVTASRNAGFFNGTSSYLTLPANAVLAFGTGDFTVETWIYMTSYNNYSLFDTIPIGGVGSRVNAMVWYITSTGKLQVFSNGADRGLSVSTIPLNQWNHIALTRSGTTWRYYINGIRDSEYSYSVTLSLATGCVIGRLGDGASYFLNGYLDNFRVTKGVARYSADFIPAAPFREGVNDQNWSSVSTLLRMDGLSGSTTFTDSSTNALTVTSVGGAQIVNSALTQTIAENDQCLRWNSTNSSWVPTENISWPVPASTNAPGKAGQISKDFEYLYVCIATNTWRRTPYSTWNYTLLRSPSITTASFTYPPAAGVADEFFNNTTLLVHFDNADGSNSFVDNSQYGFDGTQSAQSAVFISTSQSKFGGASAYFNGVEDQGVFGNGTFVTFPASSIHHFSTGNFTIEAWIRPTLVNAQGPSTYAIVSQSNASTTENVFSFYAGTSSLQFAWGFNSGGGTQGSASGAFAFSTAGVWYHVAAVRNGNVLRLFVNGTQVGTDTSITTDFCPATTAPMRIGAMTPFTSLGTFRNVFLGWIDEVRITKGVARYWTAFTPRAFAFPPAPTAVPAESSTDPYFANVGLLLHMDGSNGSTTFTDSSPNALTVTPSGNAQISTAQSKFGGSSGLFDGTGDFLSPAITSALTFGTGDFTVEAWVRITASTLAFPQILTMNYGSTSLTIRYADSASPYVHRLQVTLDSATAANTYYANISQSTYLNTWVHIAFTRSSNVCRLFINGNRQYLSVGTGSAFFQFVSFTSTANVTNLTNVTIGTNFQGNIDDLRITRGVARYVGDFVPRTTAFPDVSDPVVTDPNFSNVSLLLRANGTNGSTTFVDSSLNNLTITPFGNAQISTTRNKFGGSSAFFDGTGDYLSTGTPSGFAFGTGDFTVEAWVYVTSNTSGAVPYVYANNATIFSINYGGSGFVFRYGDAGFGYRLQASFNVGTLSDIYSVDIAQALYLNTWVHVAFTRSSGTCRIFVNGSQENIASGSSTSFVSPSFNSTVDVTGLTSSAIGINFLGYIDDLRITKGVARYVSDFVRPTATFPNG
jgi:hypothetical protein